MNRAITFHRAARAEFIEAVARYEVQRPGLGVAFIVEIERCVALAADQPELCRVMHDEVRRVIARRFPYSVYFRLTDKHIVVLAVFHGSRNPTIWHSRA